MIPIARPINYKLEKRLIKIDELVIEVLSNAIEYLYHVIPEGLIVSEIENVKIEFTLILYYTPLIGPEYTVYKQPTQAELKNFYQPNSRYKLEDYEFEDNEYPNKTIHFKQGESLFVILSGNKDVLVFYIKRYIKKFASIYFKRKGYYIMHAGAVMHNEKVYIIVGPSHSGKSTFCFNLCLEDWVLLNDDIVFLKYKDKKITIKSIQMNPCIRKKAQPYVLEYEERVLKETNYYSPYNETFYIKDSMAELHPKELKGLFFLSSIKGTPRDGRITPIDFPIDDSDLMKTLTQFDEELLLEKTGMVEQLKKIPSFSIELGTNVNTIVETFKRQVESH